MGNNLRPECQEYSSDILRDRCSAPTTSEPLNFHEIWKKDLVLSPNRKIMRRINEGCGISFSDRPIQANEVICLKVVMFHDGVFKFGLTTHNPTDIGPEMESSLCHDSRNVFLKDISNSATRKNNLIFFKLTQDGRVVYGWQRNDKYKDKGTLFGQVPMFVPVWAVFYISGRNLALKLEEDFINILRDKSTRKSQRMKRTRSLDLISSVLDTRDSLLPSSDVPDGGSVASMDLANHGAFPRGRTNTVCGPARTSNPRQFDVPNDPQRVHVEPKVRSVQKSHQKWSEQRTAMCFNIKVGRNVILSSENTTATNRTEMSNGYVFSRRPLQPEEKMIISVVKVKEESRGRLGFGLTVCDPTEVVEFPDDPDDLLDREEYWVYVKDVCVDLKSGEELTFMINRRGEVGMSRNGSPFRTVMHVDSSVTFWIFFDVSGPIEKLSCLGTVVSRRPSTGSIRTPVASIHRCEPPQARSNNSLDELSNRSSTRDAQDDGTPRRNNSLQLDLFSDIPSLLTPPLIPIPTLPKPPTHPRKRRTPSRDISNAAQHRQSTIPETQSTKNLSNIEIESFLKINEATAQPHQGATKPWPHQEATEPLTPECSVCFENPPDCVLYTCGHMCLCFECGKNILKSSKPLCPLCRKSIADVIKIYKS